MRNGFGPWRPVQAATRLVRRANPALARLNVLIDRDWNNPDNIIEQHWPDSVELFHALAISRYGPVS